MVTSLSMNDTLISMYSHSPNDQDDDRAWMCAASGNVANTVQRCDIKALAASAPSWTLQQQQQCQSVPQPTQCVTWGGAPDPPGGCTALQPGKCTIIDGKDTFDVPVSYCLAEKAVAACTVQVSTTILAVAIVCNIVKIGCLILVAFSKLTPIATIGDAISTFLQRPDDIASGVGALSIHQVRRELGSTTKYRALVPKAFRRRSRRWISAVSRSRWILCLLL